MNWESKKLFGNARVRAVHFIGIGGTGMSALAQIALEVGCGVSGSDLCRNSGTVRLSRQGARIFQGHDASQVRGADVVIYSSAIKDDNPELRSARRAGIVVQHRSEFLAALMGLKQGIAIAGSHGKTSTAGMITWVLRFAGFDPAFVIGGELLDLDTNGGWGGGDFMVAEADESDGSFQKLAPLWEVITGLDLDHVNYYPTWNELRAAFGSFIRQLKGNGGLIMYGDDHGLNGMVPERVKFLTYGTEEGVLVRARNIRLDRGGSHFQVEQAGSHLGEIDLQLLGLPNVLNALAAVVVGTELGLPFPQVGEALAKYRGVRRRLEVKADFRGVLVVEDYAHHPAEIRAALEAVRTTQPRRLWCLFQPHRYTRLAYFSRSLAISLFSADHLILTELYPAFESPLPGISSDLLLDELKRMGHKNVVLLRKEEILACVLPQLQSGDAVIIMGAGDIGELTEELIMDIEGRSR